MVAEVEVPVRTVMARMAEATTVEEATATVQVAPQGSLDFFITHQPEHGLVQAGAR